VILQFESENKKMKSIFEPSAVRWLRDLITSAVVRPAFGRPSPEEIAALEVVTVGKPPVYKASISTDQLVGRGNPTA